MKRRMVLGAVCMVMVAAAVALSGCPALGVGGNPTLGKIVVHNNFEEGRRHVILGLSVVRVADECSSQTPRGVNLLPEPLDIGESFTVKDLPDGRYYCIAGYEYDSSECGDGRCYSEENGYVTLAAGGTADWYVQ